jgi:hypothetical protein
LHTYRIVNKLDDWIERTPDVEETSSSCQERIDEAPREQLDDRRQHHGGRADRCRPDRWEAKVVMIDVEPPYEEQVTQAIDMVAVLAEGRWRRIVAQTRS